MSDNFWDVTLKLYRWFRNIFPFRQILEAENKNLEALLSEISLAGTTVIDIGTGAGNVLAFLQEADFVVAVDFSMIMLKSGRHTLPKFRRVQADGLSLPLKSNSADVMTAVGLVEYLKNVDIFFRDVAFALKKNGHAVVTFSTKGIFTAMRLLLGHPIYPRTLEEIVTLAKNRKLIMVQHRSSLMQRQVLFQKNQEID